MKKLVAAVLIGFVCVPLALCSCKPAAPAPLPADEVAALREQYAYLKDPELLSIRPVHDIGELFGADDLTRGFAVITVTGDWIQYKETLSPGDGLPLSTITTMLLPVHIDSMIFGSAQYTGSPDTVLWFGSNYVVPQPEVFAIGSRFVLSTSVPTDLNQFADIDIHEFLNASSNGYFLTENDVLLSLKDDPGIEVYSGWHLDAFAAEINAMLK